jgi:acetyl-CoA acetyltransferase family protein
MEDVFIVNGARTPMAEFGGLFKDLSAEHLGAEAAKAAMDRASVTAAAIDHVVFGHVIQTSAYSTRHLALQAGLPVEVPALTVNRLCGSGIQAVVSATQMIQTDEAAVVLCGGMESMTQAPHIVRGLRSGLRMGNSTLEDSLLMSLFDAHCGLSMAATAEKCAANYRVSRNEQDEYALSSQQRALAAWNEGRLDREVVPVDVPSRKGTERVTRDDHMRPDSSLAALAKLRPVLGTDASVTAGNASGIVDGAAALVLAGEGAVSRLGLRPLARLVAWATVGVDPATMGMGPVPAIRKLLSRTGLTIDDIDLFEVNEAFAAQYLAVERELGLDRERTNVNGGAIALGHPLGMTGARLLLTLGLELQRRGARRGIASACIGGGQGIAALVERA